MKPMHDAPAHSLETARLLLVRPHKQHLAPYTAYCASDRARYVGGPFDQVQGFEKFSAIIGHWALRGFGRYVITCKSTGAAIGHVGAFQVDPGEWPEMTWTLWADDAEGQGHAFEAASAYLAQASATIGADTLIVRIERDNQRSQNLAERLGATFQPDADPPAWMPNAVTYHLTLA